MSEFVGHCSRAAVLCECVCKDCCNCIV